MSASIVGRKRTPDGVLLEVRAIADARHCSESELTQFVRAMLDAADVVNEELRERRAAFERAERERAARAAHAAERVCDCGDCAELRARGARP
jgi:hypothetical protein